MLSISNAALDFISLFHTHNPRSLLVHSKTGRPFFFFNSFFVGVGELLVHKRERKAKEKEKTKCDGGAHDRRRRSVKGGENVLEEKDE